MRTSWYLIMPGAVFELKMQPVSTKRSVTRDLRDFSLTWKDLSKPGNFLSTNVAGTSEFFENYPSFQVEVPRKLLLLKLFRRYLESNTLDLLSHDGGPAVSAKNYQEFLGDPVDREEAETTAKVVLANAYRGAPDIMLGAEDLFISCDLPLEETRRVLGRLETQDLLEGVGKGMFRLKEGLLLSIGEADNRIWLDRRKARYFREVPITAKEPFCLVLMRMKRKRYQRKLFSNGIRPMIAEHFGIHCYCPGEDELTDRVGDEMFTYLSKSSFVIAEVTTRNPTVMYMLGLAQMMDKEVILLTRSSPGEIPFEGNRLEVFRYRSSSDLREILIRATKNLGFRPRKSIPILAPPTPWME